MHSLTEKIKNHPAVVYLGAIVFGFVAGASVYHWAIDKLSNQNPSIEILTNNNRNTGEGFVAYNGWIANSFGKSKDNDCVEKAKKAFVDSGLSPKLSSKSEAPAIYAKTEGTVAQVRCVNREEGESWWFVMVVANDADKRIEIRNTIHDALTN